MATKTKAKPISGFCANKQCEGTKPHSPSGKPMRSCDCWETCGCACHKQITEMYAAVGMDREPPEQSPEYLAAIREQHAEFYMPSLWDSSPVDGLSSPDGTPPLPTVEGTVATPPSAPTDPVSVAAPVPVFTPTPTGRRARGQLEFDVLQVCTEFVNDVYDWPACTPKLVAERIGKIHEDEPPSTGAVNAVWDRWEKLGFAEQAKKPSRFIKFTGAHSLDHLLMVKARKVRDKKRTRAEIKRGSLRPRAR